MAYRYLRMNLEKQEVPRGVREWPGYEGGFTRNTVLGAWPNGTKVVKVRGERGDATPNGAVGRILGSLPGPIHRRGQRVPGFTCLYFIEWDTDPKKAVGVASWKLERVNE